MSMFVAVLMTIVAVVMAWFLTKAIGQRDEALIELGVVRKNLQEANELIRAGGCMQNINHREMLVSRNAFLEATTSALQAQLTSACEEILQLKKILPPGTYLPKER